jgi:hypothetical protein
MAKGWKCPHCSTENPDTTLTCTGCGRIQGSVVVPGSAPVTPWATPVPPAVDAPETPGSLPPPPTYSAGDPSAPLWNPPAAAGEAPPAGPGGEPAPAATGWAVNLDAVPPASTPLWRKLPIGWLIVGVLVAGGGIAGFLFNASRSDTGEITRAGDLTANDLRVGDCFDLKDPTADEVFDVTAHPCTEAHEYEVFFVGPMADGAFPTDDAVTNFVIDNCAPAFDAFIGLAYSDSTLDFSWLSPTSGSWSDGDRAVQCAAYDPNEARLTQSLRGAAR